MIYIYLKTDYPSFQAIDAAVDLKHCIRDVRQKRLKRAHLLTINAEIQLTSILITCCASND